VALGHGSKIFPCVTPPVTVSLVVRAHFRMFVSLRPAREVRRYLYEGPFGPDETLAHLSFSCAEMLSARELSGARKVC
jgi:hypothetical protein